MRSPRTLRRKCILLLLLAFVIAPAPPARAQQKCRPPLAPAAAREPNIFTPQQEMDLGDAVAEHVQRNFRIIDDDEIIAHLRRVGERVAKNLETELRFQFFLIDLPVANAFAMPGGRIYVSRKIVAFARSEDELAGVLAHEMGHIAARQTAADMTRLFRKVLKVEQVADRKDIYEKYNQLVENSARNPGAYERGSGHEEREQLEADQIGVFAMARAGYDPQAFAAFWDRFAETKGKKGGFFSDLFGTTKPESRRLREMLKSLSALPADCIAPRAPVTTEDFQRWQSAVINYSGTGRKEALHAVVSKKTLEPPLRGDINHLRFSPDGRYVLAQDDSGVNVLTREPFAPLFRIEAPEAHPAQFTPDSEQIVFHNSAFRVEAWGVVEQQLKTARELFIRKGCLQTGLAPDGKTLACFDDNFDLFLFDTATGEQVFQKKQFYVPQSFIEIFFIILRAAFNEGDVEYLQMGFSPDAKYFAAGRRDSAVAVDLATRESVPLKGQAKKFVGGTFAFAGPDRLIGTEANDPTKSAVVSFPAGEVIDKLTLGAAKVSPAARGNYVMIRPIQNFPVGVFDLTTKKIVMANKLSAFDLYDDLFVSERKNGELGLYGLAQNDMRAKVLLPRNALGRLRAAAVSPDFKWLAVSERSRGAVWDLTKGERVFHVRGFRGAHFGDDGHLYADFPKLNQQERTVARLNGSTGEVTTGQPIGENERAEQRGPFLVLTKPTNEGGNFAEKVSVEVREARGGKTLWSRDFPKEAPGVYVDPHEGAMMLVWALKASAARAEIKADPRLGQQLSAMKEKEGDYFLQTVDARTGKVTGGLMIETGKGSFRVRNVFAAGDLVLVADSENRVLVYSLSTGEKKGQVFGGHPAVSKEGNLLSVENERGQVTVYDLSTLQKRDGFTFSSPVALSRFSADGKRLFVLTASQTTYVLNISETAQAQ